MAKQKKIVKEYLGFYCLTCGWEQAITFTDNENTLQEHINKRNFGCCCNSIFRNSRLKAKHEIVKITCYHNDYPANLYGD